MLSEVESLIEFAGCGFLKKALPSREEPDISLSIVNSKARFYTHALHVRIISLKRGSVLNTCRNDFIHRYIECVMSHKRKNCFGSRCEG